jgi:hypothetical protein
MGGGGVFTFGSCYVVMPSEDVEDFSACHSEL